MAKHIAEFKAFPVFAYGQKYAFAISSYLAAPFFMLFSPSVFSLKLPLLLINVLIFILLMKILMKDAGAPPSEAFLAATFFIVPTCLVACRLTNPEHAVEPFLWAMLLWTLRARPILFGICAAVGLLNRSFTVYALVWALIFHLGEKKLNGKYLFRFLMSIVIVYLGINYLATFSPNYFGPFDTARIKLSPLSQILPNLNYLVARLVSAMFGLREIQLQNFHITSSLTINGYYLFVPAVISFITITAVFLSSAFKSIAKKDIGKSDYFAIYLILVGLSSCASFIIFGSGFRHIMLIRFVLFAILIPIGMVTFSLKKEKRPLLRRILVLSVALVAAINFYGSSSLWREYVSSPPENKYRDLANYLEDNGVRYAVSDYWTSYHITFFTQEKVIVACTAAYRIREHQKMYVATNKYYRISESECEEGKSVKVHDWHVCPPPTNFHGGNQ